MKQWTPAPKPDLQCFGTVDSYQNGEVTFFTQIATTGDVGRVNPSVTRSMAIALVQSMDQSKLNDAFHALAQVELGEEEFDISMPEAHGVPMKICAAVGNHDLLPFELDDD